MLPGVDFRHVCGAIVAVEGGRGPDLDPHELIVFGDFRRALPRTIHLDLLVVQIHPGRKPDGELPVRHPEAPAIPGRGQRAIEPRACRPENPMVQVVTEFSHVAPAGIVSTAVLFSVVCGFFFAL